MMKKFLLVLVIISVAVGGVFADSDDEPSTPKHTVTADIGPTIIGLGIGAAGSMIGEEGLSTSGFGIGIQYDYQIFSMLGVGGRFAYLGGGFGISMGSTDGSFSEKASLGINLDSFSFEGHARFYPLGGSFFLDGMLGFAVMTVSFNGELYVEEENTGKSQKVEIEQGWSRSYFKIGAKLGWRVDFGRRGGFIFEPSFGWSAAVGIGDTFGQQLTAYSKENLGGEADDLTELDDAFWVLESFIFVGGPRMSLAFGWKF
jgi:hypothetical protein